MRYFAASASQIKTMNAREVGDVLADLSVSSSVGTEEVANEIEEFFRVNFRKISYEDAIYVSNKLGQHEEAQKIDALDDKFWIWETLEEATRPDIDSLDLDSLCSMYKGFILNMKGSEEFHMIAQDRMRYFTVSLGDLSNPAWEQKKE